MSSLVVVSNRLPVNISRVDGKLTFSHSNGGLATAMSSLENENRVWIGWPGIASDDLTGPEKSQITKELKKFQCVPVFLSAADIADFYEGYSNDTLWPLVHYFPSIAKHKDEYWRSYKAVNKRYAKAVEAAAEPDSMIWIHDYHLMLLPTLVRESRPEAKIGFFLHVPFPSYEIFRLLPERKDIIEGLMGADLVGFHIYDYARHFLSSAERVLGASIEGNVVEYQGRRIKADIFPIGIDYAKFRKALNRKDIKEEIARLDERYKGQKLILSVDRLDYSKGIMKRLQAYEYFLQKHPEAQRHVTLIMIAAPSRTEVESYKALRDEIEQTVSRINGMHSTTDWSPISYQFQNLQFDPILALCARADIALVTPMRDGMNLVAKEYIASKRGRKGVLILSEMAGAANELSEALIVNPNDTASIAHALSKAIKMPKAEQLRRLKTMQSRISDYTVQRWGTDFLEELEAASSARASAYAKRLRGQDAKDVVQEFKNSKRRLLLLDYDGTLQHFQKTPSAAAARPGKKLKNLLNKLSDIPNTHVCVISGRSRKTLDSWFLDMPKLILVAEHGALMRDDKLWRQLIEPFEKQELLKIMRDYVHRTPGALVEEKEFALVWHYRNVTPELAYVRNGSLQHALVEATRGTELEVYKGKKILEVKPRTVNKGDVVRLPLEMWPSEFILAAGDDYTDEDMFMALPPSAYTIKIGPGKTKARYQVSKIEAMLRLLESLAAKD